MRAVDHENVKLTDGFFADVRKKNAQVSLKNIYQRFAETGRFSALDCVQRDPPSHIFYDSDVAKWLEAAAYLLKDYRDGELLGIVHETVRKICAAQLPSGYFNSFYQVYRPDQILTERSDHELYCAGHLIEAAVALDKEGIDGDLLPAMKRYADYIYERFYVKRDTGFTTGGHPEIELALARLFAHTGEEKYLTLAKFFLDERGVRVENGWDPTYDQSHLPVRKQKTAEGHAVRALYLYAAMADVGRLCGDKELLSAADSLFEDIVRTKLYITGGTGSSYLGERFTCAYDLPNRYAYSETCSAVALALFCDRLTAAARSAEEAARADSVLELALVNNILAGQSWDGKGFFYTNPLELCIADLRYAKAQKGMYCPDAVRREVFECSCCPPNLSRFFGRLGDFIYAEEGDALYVRQYLSSEVETPRFSLRQTSAFPFGGDVRIRVKGEGTLLLRVPDWSGGFSVTENGKPVGVRNGRIFSVPLSGEHEFTVGLMPRLRFVYACGHVAQDSGRKAVMYGPLVLCAEGTDNGGELHRIAIPSLQGARIGRTVTLPAVRLKTEGGLYSWSPPVREETELTLIPYFAWANRGENDMQVWFL